MAGKFHINSSGDVRTCNATVRPCKFGEEAHFEDRAEARKAVEAKLEEEHGGAAPSINAAKTIAKPAVVIDQKKVAAITRVSSSTYERAVNSMASRSESIAALAGIPQRRYSNDYSVQVSELPKTVLEAKDAITAVEPLSENDEKTLDASLADYEMDVVEAIKSGWDDEDKMTHIGAGATRLTKTFRDIVYSRRNVEFQRNWNKA